VKLTVLPRAFQKFGKDNRTHFLLAGSTLTCTCSFEGGSTRVLSGVRGALGSFTLDITPALVPDRLQPNGAPLLEHGQPSKQLITRIDLDYRVEVTLGGLAFIALKIPQRLLPTPRTADGRSTVDYLLAAGGWLDAAGRQRVANAATHPLVDLTHLAAGEVRVNTLMLDITPGWAQLHRDNPMYKGYELLSRGHGLSFKVFAHTAGIPLIWYAVVPDHLRGSRPVSPHVFFQPSDNREGQSPVDDEAYLLRNDAYFKADGRALITYLLPPIPDQEVNAAGSVVPKPRLLRNVVNFGRAVVNGRETGELTTDHWNINAGLQKAFEHVGSGVPAQLLLVPQRTGEAKSRKSGSHGSALTSHLQAVTNAAFGLIESNTDLTVSGGDILLSRDKLVVSAFSESGYDLWHVAQANRDALKAIIGIEPQNVNSVQNDYRPKTEDGRRIGDPPPIGKDVIPELLKRKVKIYIIGRHHKQYGPQIADRAALRLLPSAPIAVFGYPPDPSVNDFIKYRVHRMTNPGDDPFLSAEEAAILQSLNARGITGAAVLRAILARKGNEDRTVEDGVERWYSHQFALSGGEEMHLDPAGVYGRPVTYRTWFQVAVHEIG